MRSAFRTSTIGSPPEEQDLSAEGDSPEDPFAVGSSPNASGSPARGARASVLPPEGHDDTALQKRAASNMPRRGSLATEAFRQASENKKWKQKTMAEMDEIGRNTAEMESFLRRRQSWKQAPAIVDPAEQLKGVVRRPSHFARMQGDRRESDLDWASFPAPQQYAPLLSDVLNKGSAILDHAKEKLLCDHTQVETKFYERHTLTSGVMPAARRAPRRHHLGTLARQLRPGTAEAKGRIMPPELPARAETPNSVPAAATASPERQRIVGARLPTCSDHSPVYKYASVGEDEPPLPVSPERVRGMAPSARDAYDRRLQLRKKGRLRYHGREHDHVTVVTGTVDYAGMLADQEAEHARLADADQEYNRMITTLEEINHAIARRFSRMLKADHILNLGGLGNPGDSGAPGADPEEPSVD
eukprot:TRINITY_DN47404_c0_g1_i1.p1 TRINITY_DN47404_c0_g1~~TRINITY_DN47404_c0_g1_i1.p1  ORF type:complete len:443 (+),score=118.24 TRINITY_DN47404_c0_g1_i1:85-1329(+)